jgi:serine/threonine protein phosphatase PrpC
MGNKVEKKNSKNKKAEDEEKDDNSSSLIFSDCINGKKKNKDLTGQDSNDIIIKELGENIKYFAIYDGHGVKGREASMMLKYEIRKRLINDKKKISKFFRKEQVEKYFKDTFKNIQKKFEKSNDYELSGSCAICVLIIQYKLYSINLGDSRSVLGCKKSSKKIALEMSIDHKPNRDDEMKRILASGGEVTDKQNGVSRIFKKNEDGPGLAVSRSLGDIVAHDCGVSFEPEVIEKEIEPDDVFIVIGSDGIWDLMSSPEVVGFIFDKSENKKETIAKILTEECRNRWEVINIFKQKYMLELAQSKENNDEVIMKDKNKDNNQGTLDIDDITAIVHFFNFEY